MTLIVMLKIIQTHIHGTYLKDGNTAVNLSASKDKGRKKSASKIVKIKKSFTGATFL